MQSIHFYITEDNRVNTALTKHDGPDDISKRALELSKKAYLHCCHSLGQKHPDTLFCFDEMVCAYYRVGSVYKAQRFAVEAYELCCEVLGEKHPYTLVCLNNLAATYYKIGRPTVAITLLNRLYALQYELNTPKAAQTLMIIQHIKARLKKPNCFDRSCC